MAKADLNKLVQSLRGRVGDLVFRQMPDGSIVVSSAPKKKRRSSQRQKDYRQGTFKERAQWAKWAYREYPVYAQLAADQPMLTPYNIALSDISHPPVIHRIIRRDGRIRVQASDNVSVEKVSVSVRDEHGRLLEWLEAIHVESDWWECVPTLDGKIAAQAWDIPGNRACQELQEPNVDKS
jgi:hypothetical protein